MNTLASAGLVGTVTAPRVSAATAASPIRLNQVPFLVPVIVKPQLLVAAEAAVQGYNAPDPFSNPSLARAENAAGDRADDAERGIAGGLRVALAGMLGRRAFDA